MFYSVLLSFALPINISSLFPLLVLLSFPHLSHRSWLVDSSTYDRTVYISLSTSIGRSVYLSLPRWTHTERRAEHIPTNPGSRIFQSHLPLSYFLSYSSGRGGAQLRRACGGAELWRACGGAELQRACGGVDLTVPAAVRI